MDPLTFIIKPVSVACNLACHYCYHRSERDIRIKTLMSDEALKAILDCLSYLPQPKVKIIWHGGEPLLAGKKFFRKVLELESEKFINLIQTNGVIIDNEWVKILRNFHVGVSIDGPQMLHNIHRTFYSGKGTFGQVMAGMSLLLKEQNKVGALTVITRETADYPREIFEFLYNNGIRHMNFSPCLDVGEPYAVTGKKFGQFLAEIFDLWIKLDDPKVKIIPIDSLARVLMGGNSSVCYYKRNCSNFLAIDADGSVYICGRSIGDIDRKIGNIVTDKIDPMIESEQFNRIQLHDTELSPDCQQCPWLSVCNNGCPLERKNGKFLACETIKILLPKMKKVIKQQGLLPV